MLLYDSSISRGWFIPTSDPSLNNQYRMMTTLLCNCYCPAPSPNNPTYLFSGLPSWTISDNTSVRIWTKLSHLLPTHCSCSERPQSGNTVPHQSSQHLPLPQPVRMHASWWCGWCFQGEMRTTEKFCFWNLIWIFSVWCSPSGVWSCSDSRGDYRCNIFCSLSNSVAWKPQVPGELQ